MITIDWFAPAYKAGGPVQSVVNMIEQLSGDSAQFWVFCSDEDLGEGRMAGIEVDCWVTYNQYTKVWYASRPNRSLTLFEKLLASIQPDIIFINGIFSRSFSWMPLRAGSSAKKIIAVRGMLHPQALQQKALKKSVYLKFWKYLVKKQAAVCVGSTEEESKFIRNQLGDKIPIFIASNFPRFCPEISPVVKKKGALVLISIAIISPMKNYLEVLKALLGSKQQIQYHIYGAIKDRDYWKSCQEIIKQLPSNVSIRFHGDIPPYQVSEKLSEAHVFILPSESENFGHAIFEALSTGRPVITSNNTPWKDLGSQQAGVNVSGNMPQNLAASIDMFSEMEQEAYNSWVKGAVSYAAKAIHLNDIRKQYETLFGLTLTQTDRNE